MGRKPVPHQEALFSKDIIFLKQVLAWGVDPMVKNSSKNTPMHIAVQLDRKDIAQLLLTYGAKLNEKNEKENTPLHLAVLLSRTDFVDFLLLKGAELNMKNYAGKTPLNLALELKNKKIKEMLLKQSHKCHNAKKIKREFESTSKKFGIIKITKEK